MIFQHQLLQSLKNNGDRTAIENGEKTISYSGLYSVANKITRFLLQENLGKDAIIGIQLSDRIDFMCTMVGIINAGAIFVPIDESLPDHRLQELLTDTQIKQVISSKHDHRMNKFPTPCFHFETIQEEVTDFDEEDMVYPDFDEEDSLYIYFTSGSTGKPKGVVGKNKSLANFIQWELTEFSIDKSFRCSQFVSPYFDAFLRDVFVPLLAGGTVCIPPTEKDFFVSEKMISWIDKQKINLIHCVPSLFRIFNAEDLNTTQFADLQYVLLSGEKIIPSELKNWYHLFGDRIQLVNFYGTTEATMISSFYRIQPVDATKSKIPIGRAIHNNELRIVDQDGKTCSNLVVGDLLIVSDFTSKGYFNAPELTHQKFIKLNEGTSSETVAYKTGDKARYLFDGTIELLGREDRQIKLRGIRVDLEQMEQLLFQHEWVKQAVMIKREEVSSTNVQNESLVAFVVGKANLPDGFNLAESIEKYLLNYLSPSTMPANIIVMEQLPLLSNGKINYKELLASINQASRVVVAPDNEIESKLLDVWQEILGAKIISTDDSFNRIGGNSLSIMRLISRIYKEFNVRIPLSDIFKNLTIQQQAQYVKKTSQDNLLTISKTAEKPYYHLSSTQERIYFNYKIDPLSTAYNIPMVWEVRGTIDPLKMEKILQSIIQRHESLRTEFRLVEGKVFQFIQTETAFAVENIRHPELEVHEAIDHFIRPFDLEKAPLIRAALIEAKDKKQLIAIDIHHIACDGMSQVNLYTEFLTLFQGGELKPLAIQYKDYAEWEYHLRTTDIYGSYREFWLKNFEGTIPQLSLPLVEGQLIDVSTSGGNVDFNISRNILDPIFNKLREKQVSTFSSLFSLFFMYLSQLSGQEDIIIGTNSSGRTQYELEDGIGMFAKTLPIRQQMDSAHKFVDFAQQIHRYLIEATSRQIFDLIDIVAELNRQNTTPIENLFDVMLVFQNYENEHEQEGEVEFLRIDVNNLATKYPITLYVIEEATHFSFRMEYLTSYFTSSDAQLLCDQFVEVVKNTAQNLDASISEIISSDTESYHIAEEEIDFNF